MPFSLAALTTLFLAVSGSSIAEAASPPCSPGTPQVYSLRGEALDPIPSELAYRRPIKAKYTYSLSAYGYTNVYGSERMSFEAASQSQPISHPFGPTPTPIYADQTILFEPGDGPGVVRLSWEQEPVLNPAARCTYTIAATINPIPGVVSFSVHASTWPGGDELWIGVPDCFPPLLYKLTGMPATLAISGAGGKRSVNVADQCSGDAEPNRVRTGRWRLFEKLDDAFEDRVVFRGRRPFRRARKMRLAISAAGASAQVGSFRVSTFVRRGQRIWEGTDAFINYCINKPRPIYSAGGRLYCSQPGVERDQIGKIRPRSVP